MTNTTLKYNTMKKLLFLALMTFSIFTYGQVGPYLRAITFNNNVYNTKTDLQLTQFADEDGKLLPATKNVVLKPKNRKTIRYKIIGTDGDYTIIKLLPKMKINSDGSVTVDDPTDASDLSLIHI